MVKNLLFKHIDEKNERFKLSHLHFTLVHKVFKWVKLIT